MARFDYEKLLQNVSIDEVAKRLGMELRAETATRSKALCPFHDDKSPSLHIYSNREHERQHFYCYACGAHGDAIDLVKERLNLGFTDAVDWLASSFSIAPTARRAGSKRQVTSREADSRSGIELAYRMYQRGTSGERLDDWITARNLDAGVIRRAGFIHASSNFLSGCLDAEQDKSVKRESAGLLEDAHLVRKLFPGVAAALHLQLSAGDDSSTRYGDFFIGERVVFPLYDEKKLLVGLGARSVAGALGSSSPKYQFNRGFAKASVLYRAEYAFERVRQDAKQGKKNLLLYICEGFLDALRLESLGIAAVAVMGNSLSDQQAQLLRMLGESLPAKDATVTAIVCFDRDEAGLRGSAHACLKLLSAKVECMFCWPTGLKVVSAGNHSGLIKDPNDYLSGLSPDAAIELLVHSTYLPAIAVLSFAFGITADDTLTDLTWDASPRSRRLRAFTRAFGQLKRVAGKNVAALLRAGEQEGGALPAIQAQREWTEHLAEAQAAAHGSLSEEFLNDARARLNHSRLLAYMGSRRGELPCDEPRWERLDIAATAFNALLIDRMRSSHAEPIGSYDAVWVPRTFGGSDPRLKMMPRPEDLTIQQYLLNEILTERWDHSAYSELTFSRSIPAVRYYREERRTVTTGFDPDGKGNWGELSSRTLSFAYQIDMDVLEGRQPASLQGMYRPFHECWHDFMKSVSQQVSEIGYVYAVRLDVKRYYDRLRRYVVRDSLQARLQRAIESVAGDTPGFAELLGIQAAASGAADKATAILERLDEQLFGVAYKLPDTGIEEETDPMRGIPQGPVLSAWVGSIALFPLDQEANRFLERLNTDKTRVGYARYVDDIVLLADSASTLAEMRESIDRHARSLELTLLAKAEEIPPMSADDFFVYMNQGRALATSGPAWEPPLVGDGESGWDFWSVAPTTDRQSALQLLHNVELYKASVPVILQTVRTAFQAPDLRTSELPKAARLIWYAIACEHGDDFNSSDASEAWARYLGLWAECTQGTSWQLMPEKNSWESPTLFGLEGLEHLLDTKSRDKQELSAEENALRRRRIGWLAHLVLAQEFDSSSVDTTRGPKHQRDARFRLLAWKAARVCGRESVPSPRPEAERARLVQSWRPFEWMHEAIALLANAANADEDPLKPFVEPFANWVDRERPHSVAEKLFRELLPDGQSLQTVHEAFAADARPDVGLVAGIALQTLVSVVPRNEILACLSRREHLLSPVQVTISGKRLLLPPLPGIGVRRLFSCLIDDDSQGGIVVAHGLEAIELSNAMLPQPAFMGACSQALDHPLSPTWARREVEGTGGLVCRLETSLAAEDYLRLRGAVESVGQDLPAGILKQAAHLYRAVARVVKSFASLHDDLELVPAWPYLAISMDGQVHYVIGEGVSRAELGNRAFVRDGGRALRTIEVPIYEATLWRVGAAVSDYLGLHDDIAMFSGADADVALDAVALANPARYILRAQMRKLRGAFANSQISKRLSPISTLPSSIERSLRLLEEFPDDSPKSVKQIIHVLATESESAAMFLAFREQWDCAHVVAFLKELTGRVIARLPLSLGKDLATTTGEGAGVRRDLWGIQCFARRLFKESAQSQVAHQLAWRALCAGTVCAGISVAIDGLIASLRSHGAFERYPAFDFPTEWNVAVVPRQSFSTEHSDGNGPERSNRSPGRIGLVEQLRVLIQHLGHRLWRETNAPDRVSDELFDQLEQVVQKIASAEHSHEQTESTLEWPFACLNELSFELFNLDLLESTTVLMAQLDAELGFEVVLVKEQSYGYNAQTRRFTDSRNGSWEVTPWMISQFPRHAKHVEEVNFGGRILRIWSEVYDRINGRLLSISTLGEPFASVAIGKPLREPNDVISPKREVRIRAASEAREDPSGESSNQKPTSVAARPALQEADGVARATPAEGAGEAGDAPSGLPTGSVEASPASSKPDFSQPKPAAVDGRAAALNVDVRSFRNAQVESWSTRADASKREAHVRVALLQMALDITYKHPMMEACPSEWPCSQGAKEQLQQLLSPPELYTLLVSSTNGAGSEHHWTGVEGEPAQLASWAEHRRRRILERVVDSCEAFGVDLLVLPEYSVRLETVKWLKDHIANKRIAVLAGTYMEFRHDPPNKNLAAHLTLLWPVPRDISKLLVAPNDRRVDDQGVTADDLNRGLVLEFARKKKYRSIALNELFRPSTLPLAPLFKPEDLAAEILSQTGWEPSVKAVSALLSQTRLPLKHVLELVCSEIFLISSPANYLHMADDYVEIQRRFGEGADAEEVEKDLRELSRCLSITGDGKSTRRSILAVPAATSRSADYWIAGQASQLAAGTTSVFCNGAGPGVFVGGSCFVGRGSWRALNAEAGYLATITPYHGWSKGIYYSSEHDALSKKDQAVVIADIDPYNMLEGKPRPQTMPVPLQLVAYLPLVESIDWARTELNLLLSISSNSTLVGQATSVPSATPVLPLVDETRFWETLREAAAAPDEKSYESLWKNFSDSHALSSRAAAYWHDGAMQPSAGPYSHGAFVSPAFYDWIDVSLTLKEKQTLPSIGVPSWIGVKKT